MKQTLLISALSLLLVACGERKDSSQAGSSSTTPAATAAAGETSGGTAATPASSTSTPAPTPKAVAETAPAGDEPVAEFQQIAEHYKGKQIPVDTKPGSEELDYLPIEEVVSGVKKTNDPQAEYKGYLTLRVPRSTESDKQPVGIYIFEVTYHHVGGQWEFQSATEEFQGSGQEKIFDKPVFKPELLK